jgi:hypothetical protein
MFFLTHFYIKFSGPQTFFEKFVAPFFRKISTFIQGVSAKTFDPNISVICQRIFIKFKFHNGYKFQRGYFRR